MTENETVESLAHAAAASCAGDPLESLVNAEKCHFHPSTTPLRSRPIGLHQHEKRRDPPGWALRSERNGRFPFAIE